MLEVLKTIANKHEKNLVNSGFDIAYSSNEKMLYINKGDISIICNFNLINVSVLDDGETYNIFNPDFEDTLKFKIEEESNSLKIEVERRYVLIKLEEDCDVEKESETNITKENIAEAIKFFIYQHIREILGDMYQNRIKEPINVVNLD